MRRLRVRVPPRVHGPGSSNRVGRTAFGRCRCGFESSSRNLAFRASARVFLVGTRCPGQHRGKALAGVVSVAACRLLKPMGGFKSPRPLHVTVVLAVSTRVRRARRAGSNPVGHSHALLGQLGRAASLRRMTFRVRISGGAQWSGGLEWPHRSRLLTGRRSPSAGSNPARSSSWRVRLVWSMAPRRKRGWAVSLVSSNLTPSALVGLQLGPRERTPPLVAQRQRSGLLIR
jgi:hypothetical protein